MAYLHRFQPVSVVCPCFLFFFSSRRRHTRYWRDWSSDVCSSDLGSAQSSGPPGDEHHAQADPLPFGIPGTSTGRPVRFILAEDDNRRVPLYRDEVVVLRTHKLGEADRIVTMLSRSHGKIRAVAKGVRRTSSKFGARLEPFMVADVQLYEGRSLDIIKQAESLGSYGAEIAGDSASFTAANAMVETADRLTDDDGSLQQYLLLVGALRSLARREHGAGLTLDSYLLRALSIAGWAPSFVDCAVTGAPGPHSVFVAQLGGVVADAVAPPGAPRLDRQTLDLLAALLTGDWPHAEAAGER